MGFILGKFRVSLNKRLFAWNFLNESNSSLFRDSLNHFSNVFSPEILLWERQWLKIGAQHKRHSRFRVSVFTLSFCTQCQLALLSLPRQGPHFFPSVTAKSNPKNWNIRRLLQNLLEKGDGFKSQESFFLIYLHNEKYSRKTIFPIG